VWPAAPAPGAAEPRRPWQGRRVVLGVTGSIAAYKSAQIARDLTRLGAAVDVVMTTSARSFVGAITFEALTGRPVAGGILDEGRALDHTRLAREADAVCIAPATADFIARAAGGRADDMLAAVVLATRAPVIVCPAMNDAMWANPRTTANVEELVRLGCRIVGPADGPLAHGEGSGPGRMEEPGVIVEHIGRALGTDAAWRGRHVLVTAGPTRERVDTVRTLSNRSSGRMGFAIAAAAWRRGADVTLVAGPTSVPAPVGPDLRSVETADEMLGAVRDGLARADILFMAAAVADFRPVPAPGKLRRSEAPDALSLQPAPDVLLETRDDRREGTAVVGFALETGDGRASALAKLHAKGLDLIVLNPADEPDAGFDTDTNRVVILDAGGGEEELPLLSKDEVADLLLDRSTPLLAPRTWR
jgi:phosphopantothenoylcysteine decarboxylase / phosphopantothenate---cysteine ligase